MCTHVCSKYTEFFKDVTYVSTFKGLLQRDEQEKDRKQNNRILERYVCQQIWFLRMSTLFSTKIFFMPINHCQVGRSMISFNPGLTGNRVNNYCNYMSDLFSVFWTLRIFLDCSQSPNFSVTSSTLSAFCYGQPSWFQLFRVSPGDECHPDALPLGTYESKMADYTSKCSIWKILQKNSRLWTV